MSFYYAPKSVDWTQVALRRGAASAAPQDHRNPLGFSHRGN